MKINDITPGVVYWYETRNDWGTYLRPSYDRYPVRRLDDIRYDAAGWSRVRDGWKDPRGQYVRVAELDADGKETGRERYLLARYVRNTYAAVKERYERQQAADAAAEQMRAQLAADAAKRAERLRERLAALGIEGWEISATDGRSYRSGSPRVEIGFRSNWGNRPEQTFAAMLDRIEELTRKAE